MAEYLYLRGRRILGGKGRETCGGDNGGDKRRIQQAVNMTVAKLQGCKSKDGDRWCYEMMRKYYKLILLCENSEEGRKILEDSYNRTLAAINALRASSTTGTQVEHPTPTNTVLDPELVVTQGRSKRIKGPLPKEKVEEKW